jgi:pimeloyl-ACP methyl ester carboxylesterase
MRSIRRIAKFLGVGAGAILALGAIGAILGHAYLRGQNERRVAIQTPHGIEEANYVLIGGIKQWIQIRGEDRRNPALLFLHGGPGASSLPISAGFRAWESRFTVVQWDQRGAGRTYRANSAKETGPVNLARMTADGLEMAAYLRKHLQKEKILLVGHSAGAAIGIYMIKARPELFSAFVGTGLVVDARENEQFNHAHVLQRAQQTQNKRALAELAAMGPPPWTEFEKLKTLRRLGNQLAPRSGDALNPHASFTTPRLSPIDYYYWMRGPVFTRSLLDFDPQSFNLRDLGLTFEIPVFFFHGTADQFTPIEPVEKYFAELKAPHKDLVRFEGDHHFVVFNRPDAFLEALVAHVGPWLEQ